MIGTNIDYLPKAKQHANLFLQIIRDMGSQPKGRAMVWYIPEDFDTNLPLDDFYSKYSAGERYGKFTITDFEVSGDTASISFQDVAMLSGGGATWIYDIRGETVKFARNGAIFMS